MHHSLAVLLVLMALNSSFAQLSALWNQSYNQFDDSTVEFVIETMTKDGYIVIGTYKDGSSYQHILLRTEAAGEITWTKKFEDYIHHWDCSAQPTFDGGYILCGGGTDGWLKKCDQFGDEIWMRVYGDENYQFGWNVRELVAEKKLQGFTRSHGMVETTRELWFPLAYIYTI
jgi:hypothetical protein